MLLEIFRSYSSLSPSRTNQYKIKDESPESGLRNAKTKSIHTHLDVGVAVARSAVTFILAPYRECAPVWTVL